VFCFFFFITGIYLLVLRFERKMVVCTLAKEREDFARHRATSRTERFMTDLQEQSTKGKAMGEDKKWSKGGEEA
jgi:hypothetical protein